MAYEAGKNYNVRVIRAYFGETNKGVVYLSLDFENDNRDIMAHSLYFSEKARPYTATTLSEVFDIGPTNLSNSKWCENIETFLLGQECSIAITEKEYKGTLSLVVSYVSAKREISALSPAQRVAVMFGANAAELVPGEPIMVVPAEYAAQPPTSAYPYVAPRGEAVGADGLPF